MMTRRSIDERAKRLGVGWAFFFFFLFFDDIFFLHHHVSMTYQTLRAFLFLTTKTQRKHAHTHTHKQTNQQQALSRIIIQFAFAVTVNSGQRFTNLQERHVCELVG